MKACLKSIVIIIMAVSIGANISVKVSAETNSCITLMEINPQEFFKVYSENEKQLREFIDKVGYEVYITVVNKGDTTELLKLLNSNLDKIKLIEGDLINNLEKYQNEKTMRREIALAADAISYYRGAIRSLIEYIKANNERERFKILDLYFSEKENGENAADRLSDLLKK